MPIQTGGRGPTRTSRHGLASNLERGNKIQKMKLRCLYISRRQRTFSLRRMRLASSFYPQSIITELSVRSRGLSGATLEQYTVRKSQPFIFSSLIKWTGQFTDTKNAAFPYSLASKENQTIFDEDCVPEDFVLSDPDHLNASQILSLYTHWHLRQRQKLSPFVVLKAGPLHRAAEVKSDKAKGKRKVQWVEVGSDDEDVKSVGEEEAGEEEELSEEDTGFGVERPLQFGPPGRSSVAGPSNLRTKSSSKQKSSTLKQAQDINLEAEKAQNRRSSANKRSSKKRKSEEDSPETPAAKVSKSDPDRKSGRRVAKVHLEEPLAVSNPSQASKEGPKLTDPG